jgi:hypothetical protein
MIGQTRFHRGRNADRLVNAAEIVVYKIERYGVLHVVDLFAESVCKASESAHRHTHSQIAALNETGGDMRRIGIAEHRARFNGQHNWRAISGLILALSAVHFDKLRVVHARIECALNRFDV